VHHDRAVSEQERCVSQEWRLVNQWLLSCRGSVILPAGGPPLGPGRCGHAQQGNTRSRAWKEAKTASRKTTTNLWCV